MVNTNLTMCQYAAWIAAFTIVNCWMYCNFCLLTRLHKLLAYVSQVESQYVIGSMILAVLSVNNLVNMFRFHTQLNSVNVINGCQMDCNFAKCALIVI